MILFLRILNYNSLVSVKLENVTIRTKTTAYVQAYTMVHGMSLKIFPPNFLFRWPWKPYFCTHLRCIQWGFWCPRCNKTGHVGFRACEGMSCWVAHLQCAGCGSLSNVHWSSRPCTWCARGRLVNTCVLVFSAWMNLKAPYCSILFWKDWILRNCTVYNDHTGF